ncbi:MAG: NAD(+) synthase [Defluviitaleaceae bacterium]|nr:NAD(+) synthase [Defluviitaleaceae bacterium]
MLYSFVRIAAATPTIRVADCDFNAGQIIALIKKAAHENVRLICMPELCITGCTCGDLFLQKTLIKNAAKALNYIVSETKDCNVVAVAGLPFEIDGKLYNVAAVFCRGEILGIVPKAFLKVDDLRYFSPAPEDCLVFECEDIPEFKFSVEIGEDLNAAGKATIIANISAGCEVVGKADYRRAFALGQSRQRICAYLIATAGYGESTTDMVFSGHNLICENGAKIAESLPFGDGWAVSEVDLQAVNHSRKNTQFLTPRQNFYRSITFSSGAGEGRPLLRKISPLPFIPEEGCGERCEEILNIQAHGLMKRLEHTGAHAVLGISGGLDSCLALLVTARAYDKLNMQKSGIIAVTMPCFGTTERTKSNAHKLCEALGIPCREIDITETVRQHLRDISHPETLHDVTYENAQARIRTLVLMDLANKQTGIVIGSGNLSEIALGWATYNGDHISMYNVNASVPKTLVCRIVQHVAQSQKSLSPSLTSVLEDILSTPISPELLPPKNGEIMQHTEKIVGAYELHDFFLYHFLRFGREPSQILELAKIAFNEDDNFEPPVEVCQARSNNKYPPEEIERRLKQFFSRFFSQQFKRNCMPDGPKIGSVSLSPRGSFHMPSDASNFEKCSTFL